MYKRLFLAIIFTGFFIMWTLPIMAHDGITLFPLELQGDEALCKPLASAVSESLLLSLHLLDENILKKIPEEEWNNEDRKKIIEKYDLEYIIFGIIEVPKEGDALLSFYIENPEDNRVSREISVSTPDYMEIFDKLDTFVIEIVEELTQNRFSYGTLNITNTGSASEYWVEIDGMEVGKNIHKLNLVPIGSHLLNIYTKTEEEINLIDYYEFQMYRNYDINYEFTLNTAQDYHPERTRKLANGRTLNMTRIQWKHIKKSNLMEKSRVQRNIGLGLTLGGSGFFGLWFPYFIMITQKISSEDYDHYTTEGLTWASGFMSIGAAAIITGTIFLIVSTITRRKMLNKAYAFSTTPVFAPKSDGTLTAGISVSFKL